MAESTTAEETQEAQEAPETQEAAEAPAEETAQQDGSVDVHDAELPEAQAGASAEAGSGQIDILLDSTMPVEVCLGRAEMPVGELLQLGPGSVIKLDKLAGEPVELLLRKIKFATGTLVVVGDKLGVKIKEIVSAQEEGGDSPPPA